MNDVDKIGGIPVVMRALLDAGADPREGSPSAVDTARMFGHEDFLAWFGA